MWCAHGGRRTPAHDAVDAATATRRLRGSPCSGQRLPLNLNAPSRPACVAPTDSAVTPPALSPSAKGRGGVRRRDPWALRWCRRRGGPTTAPPSGSDPRRQTGSTEARCVHADGSPTRSVTVSYPAAPPHRGSAGVCAPHPASSPQIRLRKVAPSMWASTTSAPSRHRPQTGRQVHLLHQRNSSRPAAHPGRSPAAPAARGSRADPLALRGRAGPVARPTADRSTPGSSTTMTDTLGVGT